MKYLIGILTVFSSQCFAFDCRYDEVTALQSQSGNVLVQVKSDGANPLWRNLGSHDSKYIKSYQSIAQQAIATGQQVMLRFSGGESCGETDYGTPPVAFRIYK